MPMPTMRLAAVDGCEITHTRCNAVQNPVSWAILRPHPATASAFTNDGAASSAAPASVLTSARARPGLGAEATGAAGQRGRTEKLILMPTIDPEPFCTGLALMGPAHAGVRTAT
jgi:hypothetical protein